VMRVLVILTLVVFLGCSKSLYQPKYFDLSNTFECANINEFKREIVKEFWMDNRLSPYRRVEWEDQFNRFNDFQNSLNLADINLDSVITYRINTIPALEKGESMTIVMHKSRVILNHKLFENQIIRSITVTYGDSIRNAIEDHMNKHFWNHETYKQPTSAYSDGAAFFYEGYRDDTYKLIFGGSASIEEHHKELHSFFFKSLDLILPKYEAIEQFKRIPKLDCHEIP